MTHGGYFSVAWDDRHLYILGVFEQKAETVKAALPEEHPEWWNDDTMEVFLKPDPKGVEVIHLAANPKGTRFKAYTFTTDYATSGRVEASRWVLEWAIPFASLKTSPPEPGAIWAMKVGREHQAAQEYPLWPMGGDYHAPTNFGYLVFVEKLEDPQALAQRVQALLGVEPPSEAGFRTSPPTRCTTARTPRRRPSWWTLTWPSCSPTCPRRAWLS